MTHSTVNGAYTELFAGLDKSIGIAENGGWSKFIAFSCVSDVHLDSATNRASSVSPFCRKEKVRADLAEIGIGKQYWEWCETQVKKYV